MKLLFHRAVQIVAGRFLRTLFRTTPEGFDKVPKRGAIIVASNHASNLDPLLVAACIPRPIFNLGKDTLFRNPLAGFFLRNVGGQIPVDLDGGWNEAVLEAGLDVLRRGHALGIYPEGNRSPDGRLQRSSTGVAWFAFLCGAPVYPVAIAGTFDAWPRHNRFPSLFRRTRVIVGDPIPVPLDPKAVDDVRRCRTLADDIMTAIGNLLGEPYPRARIPARKVKA
jgi:1-acyl-sn-glycerol-3-phosphate acyltransferase